MARFVARISRGVALNDASREEMEADARRRIAQQLDDDWKAERSDYVLTNDGPVNALIAQVDALWPELREQAGLRS